MSELKQNNGLNKNYNTAYLLICLVSSLVTLILIYVMFMIAGLAPFGNRTLTYSDGQFQMIDLLAWYKDVLAGKANIDYSMGKSLGGSTFAVFTYYLASPLNLLIVFFDKGSTPLFMDIIFTIKAMLASAFAAYYLTRRFRPEDKERFGATIVLAVSYGLCPFILTQSSNTMWLEGAYMLPLILAGVEKIVGKKPGTLFSVSVALALLFNWYTGIIDLLFACFWLLFELIRGLLSGAFMNKAKDIGAVIIRYALSFITGVAMSAAVLLPTLNMLSGRTHGASGLSMLKDIGFIGPLTDAVYNYSFGTISLEGSASLFTGSFVLIGVILFFVKGAADIKQKILNGGILVFTVLMFFWQPLVALFSMLRVVESYWYRYTYLASFVLIFLAASYFLATAKREIKPWVPLVCALGFCVVTVVISCFRSTTTSELIFAGMLEQLSGIYIEQDLTPALAKLVFPLLISLIMMLILAGRKENPAFTRVMTGTLAIVICAELVAGQAILVRFYSVDNAQHISDYTDLEQDILPDGGEEFFRIVQTTYHSNHLGVPLSYNEAMAYGFSSVTSFVSDPDENAVMFLDRMGYPQYSETITVTASDNLAIDSLLGVRYILLDSEDTNNEGLVYVDETDGFKTLYENPFAVPAAFVRDGAGDYDSTSEVSFEYVNDMYRFLSGIDRDVFIPLEYEGEYEVTADPDAVVFCELITGGEVGATIFMNGEEVSRYSQFLAPVQIRVPLDDEGRADVQLVFDGEELDVTRASFYMLDLDALAQVTEAIKQRGVQAEIGDGRVSAQVEGNEGQSLFISIPEEDGWTVTRNGQEIKPDLIGGALLSIPLENGSNDITMTYKVPGKTEGIVTSFAGVLMLACAIVMERRKVKGGH